MLWALWLDEDHRAAKVHLEFDILKGIPIQAKFKKYAKLLYYFFLIFTITKVV